MPVDRNPRLKSEFEVVVDGISYTGFRTCEVEGMKYNIVRDRVGTDPRHYHLSEGAREPDAVVLTIPSTPRTDDTVQSFLAWFKAGEDDRRGGNVFERDKTGGIVRTLTFSDALCSECRPDGYDATSTEEVMIWRVRIETSRID